MLQHTGEPDTQDSDAWMPAEPARPVRAAAPTASPPAPAIRGERRSGAWLGCVGFVLGALFWHVVGFWDFMERVMWHRAPSGSAEVGSTSVKPAGRVGGDQIALASIDPGACVNLVLDRITHQTTAEPCPPGGLPIRRTRLTSRADLSLMPTRRLPAEQTWSTTVEPEDEQVADSE